MDEKSQFLTTGPPSSSLMLTPVVAATAAAHRKRTNTLNSWHSACDLNPDAVIRDDDDDVRSNSARSRSRRRDVVGQSSTTTIEAAGDAHHQEAAASSMPVAPDGGWGWMCVMGCSIIHLILGGIGKSFGLIHVAITESLDQSDFAVSWIHSLSVCCRMCMGPLASMLFAKGFSCRQVNLLVLS